ncbi:MAG: hypothetical protein V4443_12295 [Pseudomonadota bacterium]
MSSANLDTLIAEFPEEKDAVDRLARILDSKPVSGAIRELTVQRLYDLIHPSSQRVLAKILERLVQQGVVEQVVRVESDALGGIGDFNSIIEVPPVLFDSRTGRNIEVRFDQIRLIYKL